MEEERGNIQLMREAAAAIGHILPLAYDVWDGEDVARYAELKGRLEATADLMEAAGEIFRGLVETIEQDGDPETANG